MARKKKVNLLELKIRFNDIFMREAGLDETIKLYTAAIAACGILGPAGTKNLLETLGIDDIDVGEDTPKNEKLAKQKK